VTEVVATIILVLVVVVSSTHTFKGPSTLVIGMTYVALGLAAGPISGCFMNPWRAIAPQIITSTWTGAWAWHVGSLVGMLVGTGVAYLAGLTQHFYSDVDIIFAQRY
jgi:glycerol uptake facilitator-like aquaporin